MRRCRSRGCAVLARRAHQLSHWHVTSCGVGVGLVADGDPQAMQHPAVVIVFGEAIGVAVISEGLDVVEQRLEFEQSPVLRGAARRHSATAASRSALTLSLRSAPSEKTEISAPSRSEAARWNSNTSKRPRPGSTRPRRRPAEANERPVMPCSAARAISWAACVRASASLAGSAADPNALLMRLIVSKVAPEPEEYDFACRGLGRFSEFQPRLRAVPSSRSGVIDWPASRDSVLVRIGFDAPVAWVSAAMTAWPAGRSGPVIASDRSTGSLPSRDCAAASVRCSPPDSMPMSSLDGPIFLRTPCGLRRAKVAIDNRCGH